MEACIISGLLPSNERTSDRRLFGSKLAPYRAGMGPKFAIDVYDAYQTGPHGHTHLSIVLRVRDERTDTLETFSFRQWVGIPSHQAIDSEASKRACWDAVAMREGDTDPEYFEGYPAELLEIVNVHGEALSMAIMDRFGED